MKNTVAFVIILIAVIYVLSPIDLFPGPVDDVIVTIVLGLIVKIINKASQVVEKAFGIKEAPLTSVQKQTTATTSAGVVSDKKNSMELFK